MCSTADVVSFEKDASKCDDDDVATPDDDDDDARKAGCCAEDAAMTGLPAESALKNGVKEKKKTKYVNDDVREKEKNIKTKTINNRTSTQTLNKKTPVRC